MHELAIAESIVQAVNTHATARQAEQVTSVRVRIGEANAVVSESLIFCFELLASSVPLLANATLQVEIIPHRARCRRCEREFAVDHFVVQCPQCETWDADVISGTEFLIQDMEITTSNNEE